MINFMCLFLFQVSTILVPLDKPYSSIKQDVVLCAGIKIPCSDGNCQHGTAIEYIVKYRVLHGG